jgi:hypothetical protein
LIIHCALLFIFSYVVLIPCLFQVLSTDDCDAHIDYAFALWNLKVKGVTIAHANEAELDELFKEIKVSVAHRVELKVAITLWRNDPYEAMHALETGRQRRTHAEEKHRRAKAAAAAEVERQITQAQAAESRRLAEAQRIEAERRAEEFRLKQRLQDQIFEQQEHVRRDELQRQEEVRREELQRRDAELEFQREERRAEMMMRDAQFELQRGETYRRENREEEEHDWQRMEYIRREEQRQEQLRRLAEQQGVLCSVHCGKHAHLDMLHMICDACACRLQIAPAPAASLQLFSFPLSELQGIVVEQNIYINEGTNSVSPRGALRRRQDERR